MPPKFLEISGRTSKPIDFIAFSEGGGGIMPTLFFFRKKSENSEVPAPLGNGWSLAALGVAIRMRKMELQA